MTSRIAASALALVCAGCACGPGAPGDGGVDARNVADADRSEDAGAGSCADVAVEAWDPRTGVWSRAFAPPGVTRPIDGTFTVVTDVLASDGEVVIAGAFTHVGSTAADGVARWSEAEGWSALGEGLEIGPQDSASALARGLDGTLYIAVSVQRELGGSYVSDVFALASRDATWVEIARADAGIAELAIDRDGALLARGAFTTIDEVAAPGLARWDGATWAAIDHPGDRLDSMLADETGLCVGGASATGAFAACRAVGSSAWETYALPEQPVGDDPRRVPVAALARDASGALVAGGSLVLDGVRDADGVARWSGAGWEPLAPGLLSLSSGGGTTLVWDLARDARGALWAVGDFDAIGAVEPRQLAPGVARWDGTWGMVGGVDGWSTARRVAIDGDDAYVGGWVSGVRGADGRALAARGVARLRAGAWSALRDPAAPAHGVGPALGVAARGGCPAVVVGVRYGGGEEGGLALAARLDDDDVLRGVVASEEEVDDTRTSFVSAVAVEGDGTVWMAGAIRMSGGVSEASLVVSRGRRWVAVDGPGGAGLGEVTALALTRDDERLYVAGTIDGGPQLLSLRHDAWEPVGARELARLGAMVVDASGALWIAEIDETGTQISRWDGRGWTEIGPRIDDGTAEELVLIDGEPVVRLRADRWLVRQLRGRGAGEEGTWFPLESSVSIPVEIADIEPLGSTLLAIGHVRRAGEPATSAIPGVLWWDGAQWRAIEGAFSGTARALAATPHGIVVAGSFDTVDAVPSWGIARLEPP